jgi:hypothetical protein
MSADRGPTASAIEDLVRAAAPTAPLPLGELLGRLAERGWVRGAREGGRAIGVGALGALEIRDVTADSRAARPGSLFVAISGEHVDGHAFLDAAAGAGAVAAIVDRPVPASAMPQVVVAAARPALAAAAAWRAGDPSHEIGVVGITGTDGKTTTSFLAVAALEAAGVRPGLIGTVATRIGGVEEANEEHATTPEAPRLQALLRAMRAGDDGAAVIETTSHGLALDRVADVAYDVAILTNVTHEHLELHGTWEAYRSRLPSAAPPPPRAPGGPPRPRRAGAESLRSAGEPRRSTDPRPPSRRTRSARRGARAAGTRDKAPRAYQAPHPHPRCAHPAWARPRHRR